MTFRTNAATSAITRQQLEISEFVDDLLNRDLGFMRRARDKLADQLWSILAGIEIPKDWRQGWITLILKQGGADGPAAKLPPYHGHERGVRLFPGILRECPNDIVLMAESTQEMQALLDICQSEITRQGLCFNVKTALLRLTGECTKEGVVSLGDAEVSSCTEYSTWV
ncbi:hypothetical protein HPB50_007571 [Hyalomma asiaticum]|uniref:Uncharacterized protein n=1 Tax=Hyalomma asiaticum TaxID=266040 RepID=A0ACB7TG40_HYAAI|nr:hypothetical protein HPB50_007571 [Hyalomma asiaticum]